VKRVTGDTFRLIRLVEKPKRPPSDLAAHGAYILTPEIFPILQKLKPRKGGEIWLPVAINILAKKRPVYVQRIRNATYYDCGSKLEYLKAVVAFALMHPELKKPFRAYLKQTAK
jgi:UTP--glucose-1-phosphate uridylyltransferase